MSDEKIKEIEKLCQPVIDWLLDNYDPMCKIIIEEGKVEVLRIELSDPTLEVRD